ncbi:MAG: pyridoxal-phosphate dependent enzyme, partial [Candidatus Woesearchaeota archaeon]
ISECPDPTDPKDPLTIIEELCAQNPQSYFHTNQYFNIKNYEAHMQTGKEILKELSHVDYIVANLGTCGTAKGLSTYISQHQQQGVKTIGAITSQGGYVPGGRNQNELYETGFFAKKEYHEIVDGSQKDAIKGMRELHQKVGILCGPTTGLVYSCLKKYFTQNPQKKPQNVVFVACDRIEQYLEYVKKYAPEIFHPTQEKTQNEEEVEYQYIQPDQITESTMLLLDTRTQFSFASGHIPNSTNIPEHLLLQLIEQGEPFPKNKNIVLICPIGIASKKLFAPLQKKGYKVYILDGGLQKWQKNGFKLET